MADNADDDLDAFFDDVDNAVKEVQEEEKESAATKDGGGKNNNETITATTTETTITNNQSTEQQRPAKRIKVTAASSVPVKSIVASSVPVVSILSSVPPLPPGPPPTLGVGVSANNNNNIHPPPPPPPPPSIAAAQQPPLPPNTSTTATANTNAKPHIRSAAGTTWTDPTLMEWPSNDFRLFIGNLAKDLKQHHLEQAFSKYTSFHMARIMYNKTDGKSRGYGFVSVLDAKDCARAIREMDQSWLGSRPIKVKLSEWKDREWKEVKKKEKGDGRRKKKHFRGY